MAKVTSGSFTTTSKNNRHLVFSWSAEQDTAKNESTIYWEVKCAGTATNYNKSAPFYVEIDGEQVYYSTTRIALYVGDTVASGSKTLSHNSNGSKSFSAKVKAAIYDASYNVSGSGSWELKDIPRGAVITKVPSTFTDEDEPTINFTNYLGNNVDSVSVCLSLDNYYSTIPYRAVGKTDTSYTFKFTEEEKAKIYEYTKETNGLKVSFYILTVIDGVEYRSKMYSTLKIVNAEPEISSFEVYDTNEFSTALTGGGSKMIGGFNKMYAKATPLLKKGATLNTELSYIKNTHYIVLEGLEGEFEEDLWNETFEAVLVDSRGNEVTKVVKMDYIEYIPLTCNVEAKIKLSETTTDAAEIEYHITGNYFNGSFGAVDNMLEITVTFEGDGGGASATVIDIPASAFNGNTYDITYTETGLSYKETWIVNAIANDAVTYGVVGVSKRLTALPVFDWSSEDFNFNVPVTFSAGLDLPQKLLHTDGGRYLHATQSVVLSDDKALSKQTIGYLMIWYYYSGGSLYAENINYTLIPKHILNMPTAKITMPLAMDDGSSGAKTVTVSESSNTTTITGYYTNDNAPNNKWVLRYIIGI